MHARSFGESLPDVAVELVLEKGDILNVAGSDS
jgi:hypothetical protein